MTIITRRHALKLVAGAAVFPYGAARAEVGVTTDRIVFGQAAPLEGPAAALGTGMQQGIVAAFEEANNAGGVHGRKLELISVNDGYEPRKSIDATDKLLNEDEVFALIGAVGTPTSQVTQPIAEAAGVPFIAPFTGAEFLRDPSRSNVVNVRASYFQETEVMVDRLTSTFGARRIAILLQDDAFGRTGLQGVKKAMTRRGVSLVAEATFERNTVDVKAALLTIRKAGPDAVILIGPYKPCAEFIKLAKEIRMNAKFVNISFVGSDALAQELGPDGEGVYVTQVVPFPGDIKIPVVSRYQAALRALDPAPKPGFVSLEGYIAGRLVIDALKKIQGEPTRKQLLEVIAANVFDLDGIRLFYGPKDNQGSDDVFLTVIRPDGTFESLDAVD